jgi:hypothetical protein
MLPAVLKNNQKFACGVYFRSLFLAHFFKFAPFRIPILAPKMLAQFYWRSI